MNSFLAHLEQDDNRKNAAFLLKNLLVLDFTVEQRIFLTKIGHYHNSQLLCVQSGANQQISSSVKDLIAHYYQYIRAKAKYYSNQAVELVRKQQRQKFMQNSTSIAMLNQINICFKIQNSILTVSDSFLNGNKSPQIIQILFCSLLKTYLFCFSIVSLAVKTFVCRIPNLTKFDLEYLLKLANYFNKQYIRNFLLFIQRNKVIENFKTLKYNELIILDQKIIPIITNRIRQLQQQVMQCPVESALPMQLAFKLQIDNNIAEVKRDTQTEIKQNRRKILIKKSLDDEPEANFKDYKNFYSEEFIIDEQNGVPTQILTMKKNSSAKKQKKLVSRLSFGSELVGPEIRKDINKDQGKKFNKQIWEKWDNIYCVS